MAVLLTLLEQHLDRQPPTVVTQATTWWETVFALVKLQESGLGVHLPVKVPCSQAFTPSVDRGGRDPTNERGLFLYCQSVRWSFEQSQSEKVAI